MPRFTGIWVKSAEAELTQLWLDSSDRSQVQFAADAIDNELAENASDKGNELSEGLRVLTVLPLKVIYAVREDDRIAEVLRVRRV